MGTISDSTTGAHYLEETTLKQVLGIPDAAMDQAMGIAYQLYLTGRFSEAETVCKGLIACDHRYWWCHSLHASVLRRLGRPEEALAAIEEGLKYEPRQAKLALMRVELQTTIARKRIAASAKSTSAAESPLAPAPSNTAHGASPSLGI
jgi:predicted Zn-dependent protease